MQKHQNSLQHYSNHPEHQLPQQQQPQQQQQQHIHQPEQPQSRTAASNAAAAAPPNSLTFNQNYSVASDTSGDNDPDYPDSRYECAICINWLNEPVLTSCGHRFCKSCLTSWLRKHNQCCPLDNKKLSMDHDVFPDNFTRREIEQIKQKCPNSPLGCALVASPIEVDRHLPTCPYRRQQEQEEKCPFASIKCDFVGRPETNALEEHLKTDMPHHMQLMLQAFQKTAIETWQPQKNNSSMANKKTTENGHEYSLPPPPPQYANEADEQIVQAMYQRIVVLEQRTREHEAKLELFSKQLSSMRLKVDPRYSNGTIVWEINNFSALVEHLRANANNQVYSHECYTSPYGYKFCARLNIQPRKPHMLSLHVHLMQSENDFHLDWPFKGRIKLCMVHPHDANQSQHDTIMTKPEIQAFHQPRERISTRGFGFLDYANISDIMQLGYYADERLLIKIEINIV